MPKSTSTPREKAQATLDAAQTRFDKKTAQHATSSALTERLGREVNDAEAARDYAAKHPLLQGDVEDVDQGDDGDADLDGAGF